MGINYQTTEEALGYQTSTDPSNTDKRYLIGGSQNTLIDYNRKFGIRNGYSRFGAGNDALTSVRNGFTWNNSTGGELPLRFYDDEWEVYIGTVDGTELNAYYRFSNSMSTTEIPRGSPWWDATENIDLMLLIQGDDNIYEFSGAVAIVDSIPDGTHVIKTGTNTWAQNRFYTTRNKAMICARTGTEYTYSAGETGTTLTVGDSTGLVAGDVLVQKIVTITDKPASGRNNDTIFVFENQLCLGSFDDNEVLISENDDYDSFTYSSPRVPGEGGILTLDGPSHGIGSIGTFLLAFAGPSGIFRANYQQITVGTTLAETLTVKKLDTAANQGALNPDCIIAVGNAIAYLSNEVALRIIQNPADFNGLDPSTYSNPIKPDFDAEDWSNAKGIWWKNSIWLSAPTNSHVYALQFVEDADGKVRRFWQPPQILPVDPFSIIDGGLYGHSNSVPETYLLFDPNRLSDLLVNGDVDSPDDKISIDAIAKRAYQSYGSRLPLKNMDEYGSEGEINQATNDLSLVLLYDFEGSTQSIELIIDGSDEELLEGNVTHASLAQKSLAQNPMGGLLNPPDDARKFRVVFEIAKEDFHELAAVYSTNGVDKFWSIIADGGNVTLSPRRDTVIRR